MNEQQRAHRERVLGHLEAEPSAQWPVGTAIARSESEFVRALQASTVLLTSVALVLPDGVGRDKAIAQAAINNALLKRTRGNR